jgi:hypothetical protein
MRERRPAGVLFSCRTFRVRRHVAPPLPAPNTYCYDMFCQKAIRGVCVDALAHLLPRLLSAPTFLNYTSYVTTIRYPTSNAHQQGAGWSFGLLVFPSCFFE